MPNEPQITTVIVGSQSINVRSTPAFGNNIIGAVQAKEILDIMEDVAGALAKVGQQGEWIHIRQQPPGALDGFVAAWLVHKGQLPPLQYGDVPAAFLAFRYTPNFAALPVANSKTIFAYSGFGPNNYSYQTHIDGSNYYAPTGGLHSGIDLAMPFGTELQSPDYGIVLHASTQANDNPYAAGPNSILIRYGPYVALFGHMKGHTIGTEILVKRGQIVQPATPLGLSGIGNNLEHLHFELRKIDITKILYLPAQEPTDSAGLKALNDQFLTDLDQNPFKYLSAQEYYFNPAPFFVPKLNSYGWPNLASGTWDTDKNGYPDKVIRPPAVAPVAYNLESIPSYPGTLQDFWKGSHL